MTLIVCRKSGNDFFIQSDSKIVDTFGLSLERDLPQNKPLSGLLKIAIVHPHVCLAFAGNSLFATEILKKITSTDLKDWNTPRLIGELEKAHRKSNQECDFILCISEQRSPQITVIKNGKVASNVTTAWIGSKPAFDRYQESFHNSDGSIPLNQRMRKAFREVIDCEKFPEVGHFHIEVYLEHNFSNTGLIGGGPDSVFTYEIKSEWDTGNQVFHLPADTPTALPMGSASYGAYGISYFRSLSAKRHGVCLHFPHANLGVLMSPQINCENPIIFNGCTAIDLVKKIWIDYKIALEGVAVIPPRKFHFIRSGPNFDI